MKLTSRDGKTWASWALIGLLWGLGRLPFWFLWLLGTVSGYLAYWFAHERRRIARRNLEVCCAQLSVHQREKILLSSFGWLGVAALTQGITWGISRTRLARIVRIQNRTLVDKCIEARRPLIILVPHFIGLELGGAAFTALVHPGVYMYQKIRNQIIDRWMKRVRQRYGSIAIERHDDLRTLLRLIERGIPFFYLPDQDAGRRGIFVPFCNQMAATVPMLGRFASLTKAIVIPVRINFLTWGRGLEFIFETPLSNFPSGDLQQDTIRMNQIIEEFIHANPKQYFWVHRRFKTRPPGETSFY